MANTLFHQGCREMAEGNHTEAVRLFREALGQNSLVPEIWNNLGIALFTSGQRKDSIVVFRQAISIAPSLAEAHNNLGLALAEIGKLDEGLIACREAVAVNPLYAEGYNTLETILMRLGREREALTNFIKACKLSPEYAAAWQNCGNAQKELGWLAASMRSYRQALAIDPQFGAAMQGIAGTYQQMGDSDRAVIFFKKAVTLSPEDPYIHSTLIMSMNYSTNSSQQEIADESRLWGTLHGILHCSDGRKPMVGRRIRVGYVSADLHQHPVSFFLKDVLKNHDKTAFEITCYHNWTQSDNMTSELRRFSDRWVEISGMDDEEAASIIASNGIDILVDLSGHTRGNRLSLFARKPAPIQISWIGYFHTTGLTAIDYLLTDDVTVPFGEEAYYAEKLYRLPGCRFCYSPPAPTPFIDTLPALTNNFITFGSFNQIAKITPQVVSLWARVLLAVPGSRLILKWKAFERSSVKKRYLSQFLALGIDPGRIEFRGASSHFLALAEYNDIDIALDTFPYNGGVTSCEAIWMGVPVVTLSGSIPIGRQTASFLTAMEMHELIATDEQQYVAIALSLARDIQRLVQFRDGLRELMASSALCNGKEFTKGLEEAFRSMVREKSLVDSATGNLEVSSGNDAEIRLIEGIEGISVPSCRNISRFDREIVHFAQNRIKVCYLYTTTSNSELMAALKEIIPLHDRGRFEIFVYYDYCFTDGADLIFTDATVKQRATWDLDDHLFSMLLNREGIDVLVELVMNGDTSRLNAPENVVPVSLKLSSLQNIGQKSSNISSGSMGKEVADQAARLESLYLDKWFDWYVGQPKPRRRIGKRSAETAVRLIEEGRSLRMQGRLEEAESKMVQAIYANPCNAEAFRNIGEVLVYQRRINEGIASFRRALVFDSQLTKARSNLLYVMNYSEKYSSREIFNTSLTFQEMLGTIAKPSLFPNSPDINRRIRIGYISPDFYRHSVSYFFEPLLSNHDLEKYDVICYSCVEHADETTARLKRMSSEWRECAGMEDDSIVKMVRDDRIDIIIDLAGHTGARIRLPVFSKGAAPVQVTWLGYPNTTGLSNIEYRITDSVADPDGVSDPWYSERLVRLPHGFLCYQPPIDAPEVVPAPSIANRFVTFGSFNMLPKLSDATIAAWSTIM